MYTIELRFSSKDLDINKLSEKLGFLPSNYLSFSDSLLENKIIKRDPFWGYNGIGNPGFKLEWDNFNEGLLFMIKLLNNKKDIIFQLSITDNIESYWWCGCFSERTNEYFLLSPFILKELANYGASLILDTYIS